jgi:exopolysaccharide production protein ExoY
MDTLFIFLALPLVLPLGILIAFAIKCVSRGPVFFKQERIGYLGNSFTIYKFRSMRTNAEVRTHQSHTTELIRKSDIPMVKMDKADSRVIPGGTLLRASGLDELPQLINVLRGDMSLVGPRPCVPYEYEQYLPWQKERFNVAPGLTGLWQVSGKNETTFNEMINLDICYGKNSSPWLDLKIILKTIPALFRQFSSAKKCNNNKPSAQHSSDVKALAPRGDRQLVTR